MCASAFSHAHDRSLDELMPIACASHKAVMAVRYGAHLGDVELGIGVGVFKGANKCDVVFGKVVSEKRPVAWVGVVDA